MKSYLRYFLRPVLSSLVLFLLIASTVPTGASAFVWSTGPVAQDAQKQILHRDHPLVREAMDVQHRYTPRLWNIPDVMGTGVGVKIWGQTYTIDSAAKPPLPVFWDQSVEGERLFMPSSALGVKGGAESRRMR